VVVWAGPGVGKGVRQESHAASHRTDPMAQTAPKEGDGTICTSECASLLPESLPMGCSGAKVWLILVGRGTLAVCRKLLVDSLL
jgi:hypothetical protein